MLHVATELPPCHVCKRAAWHKWLLNVSCITSVPTPQSKALALIASWSALVPGGLARGSTNVRMNESIAVPRKDGWMPDARLQMRVRVTLKEGTGDYKKEGTSYIKTKRM